MYSEYEFMFDLVFIIPFMHKFQSNILNITNPELRKSTSFSVLLIYFKQITGSKTEHTQLYARTLLLKPRDA